MIFEKVDDPTFSFIDLFAGIGGFRLALQSVGGECVFSSEWDENAQRTYELNFGSKPHGDITQDQVKSKIPKSFDLLCGGFPCQAFSMAGKRAGFEDTRGTLFYEVAKILKDHKPKAFILENVKGLISHKNSDGSKTLNVILEILRDDLNYFVPEPKILNALDFGVPQKRERVFIVGFKEEEHFNNFKYPEKMLLENYPKVVELGKATSRYYLSQQYLETLEKHKERHRQKGNGFGYQIIDESKERFNTLLCGGMGIERNLVIDTRSEDLIPETNIKGPINKQYVRRLTPRECRNLQGFPRSFQLPENVSHNALYRQFGNSVAVPVVRALAIEVLIAMKTEYLKKISTNYI